MVQGGNPRVSENSSASVTGGGVVSCSTDESDPYHPMRWKILDKVQPPKGWPTPGKCDFNVRWATYYLDEEEKQVPSSNPVIPVLRKKEVNVVNAKQLILYDGSREVLIYDPLTGSSYQMEFDTQYKAEHASRYLARWLQSCLIAANPAVAIETQQF